MNRFKFKTKIVLLTVIIMLISSTSLTYLGINSTEEMFLKEMENEGVTLADEIISKLDQSEQFGEIVDRLLAQKILLASETLNFTDADQWSNEFFIEMANNLGVSEFNVVAPNRKIAFSNFMDYVDWEYPGDHAMSVVFNGSSRTYMEDVRENPIDHKMYKYGGIALDNDYYVQVGIIADAISDIKEAFSMQKILDEETKAEHINYAIFLDMTGTAIAGTESMLGNTYDNESTQNALNGQQGASYWEDEDTGEAYYDVQIPYFEEISGFLSTLIFAIFILSSNVSSKVSIILLIC